MIASTSDIVVADLVHQRIARLAPGSASRVGASRVDVSGLWAALCADSDDRWFPRTGHRGFGLPDLTDFRAWLTRIVRYTDASGRPLVVIDEDFVIDRVAEPKAYAPKGNPAIVLNPSALRRSAP